MHKLGKNIKNKYKTHLKILKYDLKGNFIKEWEGVKMAAKYLGYDPTTITANLRGITKKKDSVIYGKEKQSRSSI